MTPSFFSFFILNEFQFPQQMQKERHQQVRQYIREEAEQKYTIITLEEQLQDKVRKLQSAYKEIERLRGVLASHGLSPSLAKPKDQIQNTHQQDEVVKEQTGTKRATTSRKRIHLYLLSCSS